jgi:hypothetical protein
MSPSRTRLDPDGYYERLGLSPAATRAEIVAAFRGKARVLHPDVRTTGDTGAFVAVKQAYDVLSDRQQRAAYDRKADEATRDAVNPEMIVVQRQPIYPTTGPLGEPPRSFDLPVMIWVGLGAFLCLCVYQAATHLLAPSLTVRDDIRPNAATVMPLSPSAHQEILYGPAPVRLPGTPNFYVVPAANPATLWQLDLERRVLAPLGQLPPFSMVQSVRMISQSGLLEVLLNEHGDGFISADHLTPGNAMAARRAYCGYNAGPAPRDGELLERHGEGGERLEVENRAVQPAVLKLRDDRGAMILSMFLAPTGHAAFDGLPEGTFHAEYAIGELWSRACNSFAAGMRARRVNAVVKLPGASNFVLAPDAGVPAAVDMPDQAFERN